MFDTSLLADPVLYPDPAPARDADLPLSLVVVVDTEEEFDWALPHDPASTSVEAMAEVGTLQAVFDDAGIRPCYVVDYPVASQRDGYAPLARILERGGCEIGAHLHPWVNPPGGEAAVRRNSFPGNLDRDAEHAKLERLCEAIERFAGAAPRVYKAGRYGVGPNTAEALERCGFDVDLSPTPAFDYSLEEGPDFSRFTNRAFWFGRDRRMLCIPCTGEVVGALGARGRRVHAAATGPWLSRMRAAGVLSRLRMAERIRLSPEGFTLEEMKRLTRYLVDRGVRVLTLSYHSPSLRPGCTPYVRDADDLRAFVERVERYLEFFLDGLGGRPATPTGILAGLAGEGEEGRR